MRRVFNKGDFVELNRDSLFLVQVVEPGNIRKWFGCRYSAEESTFIHSISNRKFHLHSEDIVYLIELGFAEVKPAIPDELLFSIFMENHGTFYPIELNAPKWDKPNKVHDWRNYVPESVQKYWQQLDLISRCCLYLCAVKQANNEDWD